MQTKLIMTVEQMKDHDAWLAQRQKGIGGSDAGAIMGANPWKSAYQLWLEKTGEAEAEDISEKESVYWGTVLEEPVARRFEKTTGKKVRRAGMLQSVQDPWLLADVDRFINGEKAGLEIKTANAFSRKDWEEDNLPDSYYWQCQHYMLVTGMPLWYIAVLIGGQHFDYKPIPRCESDIKALYDAENTFWHDNVLKGNMPDIDGSASTTKAIEDQFIGGTDAVIELPSDAGIILDMLDNYTRQKKEADEGIKAQKNKLALMLGDYEIGMFGDRKITYKTTQGRITVDSKKLKKDYPDIYAACVKQGKPSRILRV